MGEKGSSVHEWVQFSLRQAEIAKLFQHTRPVTEIRLPKAQFVLCKKGTNALPNDPERTTIEKKMKFRRVLLLRPEDLQTTNTNGTKNFQVQVNRARKDASDKTSIAEMHMPHTVGFTRADIVGALTASLQAFENNDALKCAELHDGIDRKAFRKEYTR